MRAVLVVALFAGALLAGCGGPEKDSDRDGVSDREERAGWQVTVDFMDRRHRYHVTSDPHLADTDGDGLNDFYERVFATDPRKADTDGDRLTDCEEVFHTVRSACEDPEWEGENDGGHRTNPTLADSDAGFGRYKNTLPFEDPTGTLQGFVRGDGVSDGDEILGFTFTVRGEERNATTNATRLDTDGDGLEDGEELHFGTDPTVRDTDADGCDDGFDPLPTFTERYRPGLQELTVRQPGRVELSVFLADSRLTVSVQAGEATDLRPYEPGAVRPGHCSTPPYDPWVPVELLAQHESLGILDLTSASNPDGAFRVDWNVREGTFRGSADGAPADGPLHWQGADGSIRFAPAVVDEALAAGAGPAG